MSAEGTPNPAVLAAREKKQADIKALEARRDELKAILDEANAARIAALNRAREVLPEYDDVCTRLTRLRRPSAAEDATAVA